MDTRTLRFVRENRSDSTITRAGVNQSEMVRERERERERERKVCLLECRWFIFAFFFHPNEDSFKKIIFTHIQEKDLRARIISSIQNNNNGEEETLRRAEKEEENGGKIGDG